MSEQTALERPAVLSLLVRSVDERDLVEVPVPANSEFGLRLVASPHRLPFDLTGPSLEGALLRSGTEARVSAPSLLRLCLFDVSILQPALS
jgi:hypothetical protein